MSNSPGSDLLGILYDTLNEQESIPGGCVLPACADRMCFNNDQMSAPVGVRPEVNKFEQFSSDGHQMSLAGVPVQ